MLGPRRGRVGFTGTSRAHRRAPVRPEVMLSEQTLSPPSLRAYRAMSRRSDEIPAKQAITGARVLPVCCPRSHGASLIRQQRLALCRANGETGATGLEPATSGVTGHFDRRDGGRRSPRNRSIHAGFRAFGAPTPHGCEKPFSTVCCPFAARACTSGHGGSWRSSLRSGSSASRSPSSETVIFGYPPSRFGGWVRGPLRRVSAFSGGRSAATSAPACGSHPWRPSARAGTGRRSGPTGESA
jgi:hypothetical protein